MITLLAAMPATGDTFPAQKLLIVGGIAVGIAVVTIVAALLKKNDNDDDDE